MFNVTFSFNSYRKKLILTSISNDIRASYLYTDKTLKLRKVKPFDSVKIISVSGDFEYKSDIYTYLKPNANNKLTNWQFMDNHCTDNDNDLYIEYNGQKKYISKYA